MPFWKVQEEKLATIIVIFGQDDEKVQTSYRLTA
jgi:hypothetical protein